MFFSSLSGFRFKSIKNLKKFSKNRQATIKLIKKKNCFDGYGDTGDGDADGN